MYNVAEEIQPIMSEFWDSYRDFQKTQSTCSIPEADMPVFLQLALIQAHNIGFANADRESEHQKEVLDSYRDGLQDGREKQVADFSKMIKLLDEGSK